MADTDQILHDLIARVDALEQENRLLRATVVGLDVVGSSIPHLRTPAMENSLSRRHMLRRAAQATATAVVAGALMRDTTQDAAAEHTTARIDVDLVLAHHVQVESPPGPSASIYGSATNTTSALWGANDGEGYGVFGSGGAAGMHGVANTGNGMYGLTNAVNASGVYGENRGNGFGVAGDTTSVGTTDIGVARAGVYGRNHGTGAGVLGLSINNDGDGVIGLGKVGVHGTSANGNGVLGEGGTGYGGQFKGNRSQVRLVPTGRIGKPTTGTHQIGELYLDKLGALFICTVSGTPGTWKTVTVS